MKDKVIYEKHYSKQSIEELQQELDSCMSQEDETECIPFDEFMKGIYKKLVYVLLPERQESAKEFIKQAVCISRTYEIDMIASEHIDHISVDFFFDAAGDMSFLKDVIAFADNISFFTKINGFDITLSLDHYTHAVYRNNRRIRP